MTPTRCSSMTRATRSSSVAPGTHRLGHLREHHPGDRRRDRRAGRFRCGCSHQRRVRLRHGRNCRLRCLGLRLGCGHHLHQGRVRSLRAGRLGCRRLSSSPSRATGLREPSAPHLPRRKTPQRASGLRASSVLESSASRLRRGRVRNCWNHRLRHVGLGSPGSWRRHRGPRRCRVFRLHLLRRPAQGLSERLERVLPPRSTAETGYGTVGLVGSGADAFTATETGYGKVGAAGYGTATTSTFNVYTKAGYGGCGSRRLRCQMRVVSTESGYGTVGANGSAPSASADTTAGVGVAGLVGAGVSESVTQETGYGAVGCSRSRHERSRVRPRLATALSARSVQASAPSRRSTSTPRPGTGLLGQSAQDVVPASPRRPATESSRVLAPGSAPVSSPSAATEPSEQSEQELQQGHRLLEDGLRQGRAYRLW